MHTHKHSQINIWPLDCAEEYVLTDIDYMDSTMIIPIFVDAENGAKIINCEGLNKNKWYEKKIKIS